MTMAMGKPDKPKINLRDKFISLLELPKEIVANLPLISIVGNEEIKIENYKNLIEYTQESIRINTSCGIFKIEGKKLILKHITAEAITVTGLVTKLEYIL